MTYLETPTESVLWTDGEVVPNYLRVFALAPDAYAGWRTLAEAVVAGLDPRRYELVTWVAARRLRSPYCERAHAAVLRDRFVTAAELDAIAADRWSAGLDPADLAAMDFADRIAGEPGSVTEDDVAAVRAAGLSDGELFQVVLAVMMRRFFAGVLDATRTEPDPHL